MKKKKLRFSKLRPTSQTAQSHKTEPWAVVSFFGLNVFLILDSMLNPGLQYLL